MLEAGANLPSHIARGAVKGIKGTYCSSVLNVKPARTTEWRCRKRDEAAAAIRDSREASFQKNPTKKSMVTHFIRPRTHTVETSTHIYMHDSIQLDSLAMDVPESDTESAVEESEAEGILDRHFTPSSEWIFSISFSRKIVSKPDYGTGLECYSCFA